MRKTGALSCASAARMPASEGGEIGRAEGSGVLCAVFLGEGGGGWPSWRPLRARAKRG
jgi:hypothetical protein